MLCFPASDGRERVRYLRLRFSHTSDTTRSPRVVSSPSVSRRSVDRDQLAVDEIYKVPTEFHPGLGREEESVTR
jgi:hypothetical protein